MESMRIDDQGTADPTAVFGRRCVAFAVDFIILLAVFVAALASLSTFEDVEDPRIAEQICLHYDSLGGVDVCTHSGSFVFVLEGGALIDIALWVVVASALNLVVVAAATGGSLGKLAAGIRVVDQSTFAKAAVHKHLVRWILWIVDAFPWFIPVPLTGLISCLVSKGRRRVADFAAKTLVVDKKHVGVPTLVDGVNDSALSTAPLPGHWSPPVQVRPALAPPAAAHGADPASAAPTPPPASDPARAVPEASDDAGTELPPDRAGPTAEAPDAGRQSSHPGVDAPVWDAARDTYIQWDHVLDAWMEWDASAARWIPISQ